MVLEKPESIPRQCVVTAGIGGKGWEEGAGRGREQSLTDAPLIAQCPVG